MPCGRERDYEPSLSRLQDANNNAVIIWLYKVTRALILFWECKILSTPICPLVKALSGRRNGQRRQRKHQI